MSSKTEKSKKLLTLCDILIMLFFVLAASAGMIFLLGDKGRSEFAEIYIGSEKVRTISLAENSRTEIPTEHGKVVLVAENGSIWVESSPCVDKICVASGKKSASGDSIVCLPEKLLVVLRGDSGVDVYV